MPLYEFHCKACGKDAEILVRSSDWKGTPCPSCGSKQLVKKLSVFAAPAATSHAGEPACSGNPAACHRCACSSDACGLN